jgi:hypothetical protein
LAEKGFAGPATGPFCLTDEKGGEGEEEDTITDSKVAVMQGAHYTQCTGRRRQTVSRYVSTRNKSLNLLPVASKEIIPFLRRRTLHQVKRWTKNPPAQIKLSAANRIMPRRRIDIATEAIDYKNRIYSKFVN